MQMQCSRDSHSSFSDEALGLFTEVHGVESCLFSDAWTSDRYTAWGQTKTKSWCDTHVRATATPGILVHAIATQGRRRLSFPHFDKDDVCSDSGPAVHRN